MTHRVVFLQSAADDLFEIRRYVIKHFSVHLAGRLREDQEGGPESERFPGAGHAPPELPATHFLEIIAAKNRVITKSSVTSFTSTSSAIAGRTSKRNWRDGPCALRP